jgi:tetratricopeptide (TPR) repeat protein
VAKRAGHKKTYRNASGQRGAQHGRRWIVEPGKSTTTFGRNEFLIAFGLVAVTLAVYAQVMSHPFIFLDDDRYIRGNPIVKQGLTLTGIAWAFTTFYAANWHPLTWLSHMLDCQVFGLNAGGHLLVNALIHAFNTLLLFLFLRRVTGTKWQSAIVAALFALHPLHVESVAWAAERKDTLSTFFGLLTLMAYARYVEVPSWKRYALVVVALALGLMAKPMLVSWPFVLLLLDYWPLRRFQWQPVTGNAGFVRALMPLVREKVPLFCLAVASMVITFVAQSQSGAVRTFAQVPASLRLSNAIVSYAKYLLLTIWPRALGVDYPFSRTGVPIWQLVCAIVLLSVITVLVLRKVRERPYLLVGWLWFVGTLVPVIGVVQVGRAAMADRYYYVPSIGLFVALVFGLSDLAGAFRIDRVAVGATTIFALSILACLTAVQIGRWRNDVTLLQYASSVTPDNRMIENNLGTVLAESGRYDEAAAHFAKALRIKPDFMEGITNADRMIENNLGSVLGKSGRYNEAAAHLAKALRIKPDFVDALVNMGITLSRQGKGAEAIQFYDRALAADPTSVKARVELAQALLQQGKIDDALRQLYGASELAPGDANIRTYLGMTLSKEGRAPEAIEQLNEVLRLSPNSAEAHNNLGLALLSAGKAEESIAHFLTAIQLKPELAAARRNLRRAQMQIDTRR